MEATFTISQHHANPRILFYLLLVAAVGLAGWTGLHAIRDNVVTAPPVEVTSAHADMGHKEAPFVRQTCKERGVYQIWREMYDRSTFHLLCQTKDGKLVDWIITVVGGKFIEKTAFMPRNGVAQEVIKYVSNKATRFTGGWK